MDQAFRKLNKRNNFLKRTLQLTLCVYIFFHSLLYLGFSFFPHSFNVYFSTLLFSFLTHTFERKYMFLICNGILVFLVKTSGSCTTTTTSPSAAYDVRGDEFSSASELSDGSKALVDDINVNEVPIVETHEIYQENVALAAQDSEAEEEEKEQVKGPTEGFIAETEDNNKEGESGSTLSMQDGDNNAEVEATEEANGDIQSVDELNRRIEEFIRKMKEEIRIEAQQQLITV